VDGGAGADGVSEPRGPAPPARAAVRNFRARRASGWRVTSRSNFIEQLQPV
jgi:hypothetical protein